MKKVDTNVDELVGMIERGELRLPEMQRQYVWRAPRVRDLLDSLYRGYPSGSVLVWETDDKMPTRDLAVSQELSPFSGHKLLLDGQQRLTSLSAVIRGEQVRVRGRKKPIDILFNLEHPESLIEHIEVNEEHEEGVLDEDGSGVNQNDLDDEVGTDAIEARMNAMTFVVSSKRLELQPHWVSVTEVFKESSDAPFLKKAGVTDLDDPRCQKYSARLGRLRSIKKYPYSMHVLERGLSYEEVAEIFVRVNSLGTKLRGSDLALAQITARWRGSLKPLEDFQAECKQMGFDLPLGLLVRAMVVTATGQSRFLTVASLSQDQLKDGWEQAKVGLRFAINFLRTNAGIGSPVLLSSPFFLLTIAAFALKRGERLSTAEERMLRYWLYVANARGRYSRGSSETILDQDLAAINKGNGLDTMLEAVKRQFGRLHIEPGDLEGRTPQSSLFKTMFLALRHNGAKDWHTSLVISLSSMGVSHKLQFHHIFPKAKLRDRYSRGLINDIANFAFISGKTNRKISAQLPSVYLVAHANEHGTGAFESQCIPVDPDLLDLDAYPDFLVERRQRLADTINAFLEDARDR